MESNSGRLEEVASTMTSADDAGGLLADCVVANEAPVVSLMSVKVNLPGPSRDTVACIRSPGWMVISIDAGAAGNISYQAP